MNPVPGVVHNRAEAAVLRIRLPVMGVPVDFETDAALVRDALEIALGSWRFLEHRPELVSRTAPTTPLVSLRLAPERPFTVGGVIVSSSAPGSVELNGHGVRGSTNPGLLTARCTVTRSVLEDRYLFEETVLPSLVLNLTSQLDRQPLHAAAIRRGPHTLLLHGRSGAGKSTLAYTALRSGWHVLSDDAVFLQSAPRLRIWARAPRLHLPPEASVYFPEVADRPLVLRPNGRWKLWVEPPAAWAAALRPAEHAMVLLLEPGTGEPEARRVDGESAVQSVLGSLDAGFDMFRDTIGPVLRTLVREHAWVVRTAADPRRTMALLEQLVGT
jgi:hypothetical protein